MVEEDVATTDSNLKPNSGADWAFPLMPFPGPTYFGRPHMSEHTARANLMALDMAESWLTAARQTVDLWRTMVREAQDGMLASYRQLVVDTLAHDLLEEMEAPKPVPTSRQPRTDAAKAEAKVPQAA